MPAGARRRAYCFRRHVLAMVLAMSRRSPPLYRTDHSAYSVQVRILVSDLRFGSLFDRILRWLAALGL
jgi:hypothetical protein